MSLESYLHLQPLPTEPAPSESQASDRARESLIHRKSGILSRKLEILATEMMWRLRIAAIHESPKPAVVEDSNPFVTLFRLLGGLFRRHRQDHPPGDLLTIPEPRADNSQEKVARSLAIIEAHRQCTETFSFTKRIGTLRSNAGDSLN